MSEFVSVERIKSLKQGIEAKTGETYTDLTAGVQALVDGYGVGSAPVLTDLDITENGEYTPPDGVDGFGKVTANVAGSGGAKIATGTIVLNADAGYIKVTGLGFTPKAFALCCTKVIQNSACGGMFINSAAVMWRTGTNNTSVAVVVTSTQMSDYTVYPDDRIPANGDSGVRYAVNVLETGFVVSVYNAQRPYKAGAEFEWIAMG